MAAKKLCANDRLIRKADGLLERLADATRRIEVLEAQVRSLQMSVPRGIENAGLATLCANQVKQEEP